MVYPNFINKHLEESLFNPKDYLNWTNLNKGTPLKKYIIIYYPKILNYFKRKYKPKKIKINSFITIYKYKDIGVVCMTGIGSPHAVGVTEELIALGGREFLSIGSAGGLKDFGIFLCEKSIRDEGTSHHYVLHEKFAYPDQELTKRLEKNLIKNNIDFQKGASWTIDAAFRETKAEIKEYKKQNISTVEMESAALFTLAKFRKVKIAAAFVVSDVLGEEKWNPQFDAKHVQIKLNELLDNAIDTLRA